MRTEHPAASGAFQAVSGRAVAADFDGGSVTSDAGALLLGQATRRLGLWTALRLVSRIIALRGDPVMAVLAGELRAKRRTCAPVAGKSTLNRLELGGSSPSGDSKIVHDGSAIADVSGTLFLDAHEAAPDRVVLDFDAMGDPVHGAQEGRFFHSYYDCYCYLPLDVSCGRRLLAARPRPANIDGAAGAVEEAARLVALLRARWPDTRMVLRADSGFAREALMAWCEANGVDYLFGLARNERLAAQVADFMRSTRDSWSRERRVVGKAEWTRGKANPRFVVTSLAASAHDARSLYEDLYCQCGEMENRIEECQLDPFAAGASAHGMRANQLRLWFASMAYVLLCAVRRLGLAHTCLAAATCGSLRLELLEIAAWVRIGVRRIEIAMDTNPPFRDEFRTARR